MLPFRIYWADFVFDGTYLLYLALQARYHYRLAQCQSENHINIIRLVMLPLRSVLVTMDMKRSSHEPMQTNGQTDRQMLPNVLSSLLSGR